MTPGRSRSPAWKRGGFVQTGDAPAQGVSRGVPWMWGLSLHHPSAHSTAALLPGPPKGPRAGGETHSGLQTYQKTQLAKWKPGVNQV